MNDVVGVRLNKSYQTFVCKVRGYKSVLFVERDVLNFMSKQRRALGKEGDGKALL